MTTAILAAETEDAFAAERICKQQPDDFVFGKKVGLIAKLFGCWHDDISRPFTQGQTAYRSCLQCGARKQFDTKTLRTYGAFYFPPVVKELNNF